MSLSNPQLEQSPIELQFCQWPEFRLELVGGKLLVDGTLESKPLVIERSAVRLRLRIGDRLCLH